MQGQFFSTPTSLFASFGPQDEQQTYLIRVTPGEVNLGKIAELDDVATGVLRGAVDPSQGSQQIDRILSEPPRYGRFVRILAYGAASAAASRFLGGGLKEIAASAFIGLTIGLLSFAIEKNQSVVRVFEPLAAFTASFIAGSLSFVIGPYAVSNSTLAGLIGLMPGLNLTVASNWYARLLDRPAIITQVPEILLLVPGSVGFRALAALLDEEIISGVETTFKMIITAVALVAGTLIANIVAPPQREL